MSKAAPVSKFEKFLMYAVGVLVSSLMAIQVSQMSEIKTTSAANHNHSIRADAALEIIKDNSKLVRSDVKKIQRQVAIVCSTQKQYWPEHAKDCF